MSPALIETKHDAQTILEAFATFPVFSLYLRYAVIDVECKMFVDNLESPKTWVLFADPGVFFFGEPSNHLKDSIRSLLPMGSWIISPSEAWDTYLKATFRDSLESFPRVLFDASALSVPQIQSLRTPLPDELKIEPIGPNHLKDGIMQREILDRFFQKRPFLEHGFGVVLTDAANAVHGFAMTNYPLDGSSEIEVMFRVGTNQDERYRGRGIATTLASHFLEEAILRGYSPQWDAANDVSAHIARKFGYTERLRWHMHHLIHPSE